MYDLVFLSGPKAGEMVPVKQNLIAGRSPDCSLEVPDPNTSRQHARILWDGTTLQVADNGSSNGTFLNDQRITQIVAHHGDVIRLGETRIRIQRHAVDGEEVNSSSIFSFKDVEADLSQSVIMPVAQVSKPQVASQEVLTQRLNAIMKISKALVNISHVDEVLGGILDTLFEVFPQADRGFLMLGKTAGKLVPKAVRQRNQGNGTENLVVSNSICKKALESRSAFLFNPQNNDDFDQGMSIVSLKIRSAMTIPMMVLEETLGLLQIDTGDSTRAFTTADLELAVAVSQQAAIALHNALLLSKVQDETTVKNNLLRFLPLPVAQQVLAGNLDIAPGGKTYRGTILFSDILGFTSLSESRQPEDVVRLMNSYFDRMVPCIVNENGAIDKFIGDAIMAFWGIPFDKGDSAAHGCHAGLSMQNALVGFNSLQERDGFLQFAHGIGLNSGTVVAGNIGGANQVGYTLLGDAVNTAARIERNACRNQVLISETTWNEIKGRGYGVRMPPLKVRNKSEPVSVISLRGLNLVPQELTLHVPCMSGKSPVFLIRRLADRSFIALHPSTCDITAATLVTEAVELPGLDLGTPTLIQVLQSQQADGVLMRTQITLADPTLKGLLGLEAVPCPLGWDQMVR
jgi:adenylate cyclase